MKEKKTKEKKTKQNKTKQNERKKRITFSLHTQRHFLRRINPIESKPKNPCSRPVRGKLKPIERHRE